MKAFEKKDLPRFEKDEKIGLVGTIDGNGLPRVSLITSLQAADDEHLLMGQFCEGISKDNLRQRPESAFLILTLDMSWWHGKMHWTGETDRGDEIELFNSKPMWRYNTYFGIHRVHFLDLKEVSPERKISIPSLLPSILAGRFARLFIAGKGGSAPINRWTAKLLDKPSSLSFLSWIDEDGYPLVIPALQLLSAGRNRVIFPLSGDSRAFRSISKGTSVAVFSLSLQMESALLRGSFTGIKKAGGIPVGIIDIDWVYNSMPPVPGQIYPQLPLEPVVFRQ